MVNDMPFNKSDLIRFLRLAGRQDRQGRLGGGGTLHRIAFTFGPPIFIMQIGCFISPLQIYRVAMTNVLLLTEIFQFHLFENFFFNLQKKKIHFILNGNHGIVRNSKKSFDFTPNRTHN